MVYMIGRNALHVFSDQTQLFAYAVENFSAEATTKVKETGQFTVALSGGNTPKKFFDALVRGKTKTPIPWEHILFFFGDERYVPLDDPRSNFHTAHEHLFSKLSVKSEHIFPVPTQYKPAQVVANKYTKTLSQIFKLSEQNPFPAFDLLYLGLGDNAHTASLMPQSQIVCDEVEKSHQKLDHRLVVPIFDPVSQLERLTLTPNAINASKNIIFLVTGDAKAQAVSDVLMGPRDPKNYPAQLICSKAGTTQWYLDQFAAQKLDMEMNHDL